MCACSEGQVLRQFLDSGSKAKSPYVLHVEKHITRYRGDKKGMIWRVSDGHNLNIWTDPWLPKGFSRRPVTPRGSCILNWVEELIDPMTGEWDEQLVLEIFWPEDAQTILAMPVHAGTENVVAWHFDIHGKFSVRSAYKVYRDVILTERDRGGVQGGAIMPLM